MGIEPTTNGLPINRLLLFEPLSRLLTLLYHLSYLSSFVCFDYMLASFLYLEKKDANSTFLYIYIASGINGFGNSAHAITFLCMRPNPHASGFSLYNTSKIPNTHLFQSHILDRFRNHICMYITPVLDYQGISH